MIEVAISGDEGWPAGVDWAALAARAADAAVRATPHGALADASVAIEISVRLADDDEVRVLNRQWRDKDRPTNVLSFPMVQRDLLETLSNSDDGEVLLGDIILARGICESEAAARGIAVADHATHLIVHGTLHLLGYDHVDGAEGDAMEAIERSVLGGLGIADPYAIDDA